MASRFKATRVGAAILGASVALMVSALPASAEVHVQPHSGGDKKGLQDVRLKGKDKTFETSLIGLKVQDQGKDTYVQSYCVEIKVNVDDKATMSEVPWDKHPDANSGLHDAVKRAKINWILHNSYPAVESSALGDIEDIKRNVSDQEAIAATQVAIWHFSDGAELDTDDALKEGSKESEQDVIAVYKYLTGDKNVGIADEPTASLDIAPKDQSGKAGDLIGPFVVTTTADKIAVKAALDGGAKLTDKDGKELAEVKSGEYTSQDLGTNVTEIFVKVPAEADKGEAKFTVEADTVLDKGRLFIRSDNKGKSQTLVVASPVKVSVKSEAKAKWEGAPATVPTVPSETTTTTTTTTTTVPTTTTTAAPVAGGGTDDDLASTGASIFVPLIIGIGLLGAGAGALLLVRRRKATV